MSKISSLGGGVMENKEFLRGMLLDIKTEHLKQGHKLLDIKMVWTDLLKK